MSAMSKDDVLQMPHSDQPERQSPEATSAVEGQLALDIFADDFSIFVIAPVAGIDPESVKIDINEDTLTIIGIRPRPAILPKAKNNFVEECYWGKFKRTVLLPTAVNSDDATAKLERDIIVIQIPKARKAKQKDIRIIA